MRGIQILLVVALGFVLVTSSPSSRGGTEGGKRLIKTSEREPVWLDQDEIWSLIVKHQNFMDVTDHSFPVIDPKDVNIKGIN